MELNHDDFNVVINLMIKLHIYTGLKQGILKSTEEYDEPVDGEANYALFIELRDILFNNPAFYIDGFIQENQKTLSPEEVEILHSWKKAVKGKFFIERHLKKYTIFIQVDDIKNKVVYAVTGLNEPLTTFFPSHHLPLMVEAVLLPFKHQMIADGLFRGGNIFFGSGIKNELKRDYMTAKQQNRIIYNLPPAFVSEEVTNKIKLLEQPWKAEVTQIVALTKKLRGGKGQPELNSVAFSLLKASAEFAELVVHKPEDALALEKFYSKLERLCYKLETAVYEHTCDKY